MNQTTASTPLDEPLIKSSNQFPVVGVGASAGGLEAFKRFIKAIPADSGMAYVLVQHLDPNHESILTELLQKITEISVSEITDEVKVQPDHIYIIPSNKMLVANDGVLHLSPRPEKSKTERNLPIDLFFTSLAAVHQAHAIGVVLSGTASDGTLGLKAIKDNGGITFAQDEDSAAYEGMPNSAARAGVVDFVLTPEDIAAKLVEIKNKAVLSDDELEKVPKADEEIFRSILTLLRLRKGTDFTHYKQTTVRRRILRRMAICKSETLSEFLRFLHSNKNEQDLMYQDLLIPVTEFFRDAVVFDNLCKSVFPEILKNKPPKEPIRIWVAGCSTGQEAFSMAICLTEFLGERREKVQIFATDISEHAITRARSGVYSVSEVDGISDERLERFFTKRPGGFRINKNLRDLCVFATHNFLNDPPFSHMDFISCRNVMIYMEPYLQKKALTTFHYGLNPHSFLLLGKSETKNTLPSLFDIAQKHDKIFTRKDVPARPMLMGSAGREQTFTDRNKNAAGEQLQTDFQKTADDLLLNRYTPASVVINEAMDIVHFRGNTGMYLEQAPGKPSHNLIKMAKSGLGFELRNIIQKVKKLGDATVKENIPVQLAGIQQNITLEALPLSDLVEPHYLILFQETPTAAAGNPPEGTSGDNKPDDKNLYIQQLERELLQAREDMRSITEDQESANEELQSANEELLSSSEELQSLNEELESGKEELQSTNEELTILNHELLSLNGRLSEAQHYAESIVATVSTPLLVLDRHLRIRSANESFYKNFQVKQPDTIGKLIYEIGNGQWSSTALRNLLEGVLDQNKNFGDFEVTHSFPEIGERIMMLNGRKIIGESAEEKLILLAIDDITELSLALKSREAQDKMFQNLLLTAPAFICTFSGPRHVYELVNERYQSLFGRREIKGKPVMEALPELEGQGFDLLLDDVYNTGKPFVGIEISSILARDIGLEPEERFFNLSYQPMYNENQKISGILVFGYEVTEEVKARMANLKGEQYRTLEMEEVVVQRTQELQAANEELLLKNSEVSQMNKELESFTYITSHDLQEPLRKIQTFARMVLDTEYHNLSEKGKGYFDRMNKAASRMQKLIEGLLEYSHLDANDKQPKRTDIQKLIEEVQIDFEDSIAEKKAVIETNITCNADINDFHFRQVMVNLITNALKFSIPGTPPHILISCKSAGNKEYEAENTDLQPGMLLENKKYHCISVSDNGIGFEPEYKDKIFEVFQRLHGKEDYAGTGIGLAIVKKIVQNHQGFITAKGELNKGATFDMYLPEY